MNGLKVILDVESFDYAFTDRGALGFRIALTDARDQAAIYQDSSNIFPGKKQYQQNTEFISWREQGSFHQHVYEQLLDVQILKAQKDSWVISVFLHFWDLCE